MGKLTPEMHSKILEAYAADPSYTKVAKKYGMDWRTVKSHISCTKVNNNKALNVASEDGKVTASNVQTAPRRSKKSNQNLAFKSFEDGNGLITTIIRYNLTWEEGHQYFEDYQEGKCSDEFFRRYKENEQKLRSLLDLDDIIETENRGPISRYTHEIKCIGGIIKAKEEFAVWNNHVNQIMSKYQQTNQQSTALQSQILSSENKLKDLNKLIEEKGRQITALDGHLKEISDVEAKRKAELEELNNEKNSIKEEITSLIVRKSAESVQNHRWMLNIFYLSTISAFSKNPESIGFFIKILTSTNHKEVDAYLRYASAMLEPMIEQYYTSWIAAVAEEALDEVQRKTEGPKLSIFSTEMKPTDPVTHGVG